MNDIWTYGPDRCPDCGGNLEDTVSEDRCWCDEDDTYKGLADQVKRVSEREMKSV